MFIIYTTSERDTYYESGGASSLKSGPKLRFT